MNKKDKNEMLEEAESVYSCVSEQVTNFTMFPVAKVVFTKMWNFLLLFFFLKFLFWNKIFLQNQCNTIENSKKAK